MVKGELNANCDQSVLKNVNINSGCSFRIYSADRYVPQFFLFIWLRFGPREKKQVAKSGKNSDATIPPKLFGRYQLLGRLNTQGLQPTFSLSFLKLRPVRG